MKITFYHSSLCPRCLLAARSLRELQKQYPDLEVEKIDVTTTPFASYRQGITIIPALVSMDRKLSGIFLTQSAIRNFIESLPPPPSAL